MRRHLSALLLPAALGAALAACSPIEIPVVDASSLPTTTNLTGPYEVTARVQARRTIESVVLVWENAAVDTVQAQRVPMSQDASGVYSASIPGQGPGAQIAYHVEATDSEGDTGFDPPAGSSGSTNAGCGDNYCFDVVGDP